MKVALGTVYVTEDQARAVSLALTARDKDYLPKWPKPATRDQCRGFLQTYGWNGLMKMEKDLAYLKARHEANRSWRRGQPELEGK